MSDAREVWTILIVFKNGQPMTMCADEHTCKTCYENWIDSMGQGFEVGDNKLIEIDGFTDSADRAPCKFAFLYDEVLAIRTWRMY